MTKSVRIENADTSGHKVRVYTEELNLEGQWVRQAPSVSLDHPTSMLTATIWRERRLVIEELRE